MFPNPVLTDQLVRDKQAEMREYRRTSDSTPSARGVAWLIGLIVVVLTGAGLLIR